MRLNKGLVRDVAPINQPEGTYTDARNMIYSRKYNSLSNEDGLTELFDFPYQPIGIVPINNDEFVSFTTNNTISEIGLVSNGVYTRILRTSSDGLNFNQSYPIKGKFRLSNRGHRVIAFTDNYNPPRILNIDSLPFSVDGNKEPVIASSIDIINIFNAGDPPLVNPTINSTGGVLPAGAYYVSTSYVLSDGTEVGYSGATGPLKINNDSLSSLAGYDGCEGGTTTSKSITVFFTDVDTRYSYMNIGIAATIAGETTFFKVGQINITPGITSYNFTYTGNEITISLLLENLTVQSQGLYNKAKAITVLNDKLTLGNLSSRTPYNYQAYANDIIIKWTVSRWEVNNTTLVENVSNLQQGGFRAFEVYAFYIAFRYKDGSYSPGYHIPGRATLGGSETAVSSLFASAKKYQVEDTCLTDGTMSFWENENETYPTGFPDFAGQKVRHHKFPSLNYIMQNCTTLGFPEFTNRLGNDLMPILSFNASNVVIPSELADEIDGWQIYYAKRDIANTTCVGQGHLVFAHKKQGGTSNTDRFNGVHNAASTESESLPSSDKLTFHSFDLLLNKPSIAPSYIRNEVKLSINVPSTHWAGFTQSNSEPIIEHYTDSAGNRNREVYKFLNYVYTGSNRSTVHASSADLIRAVSAGSPLYVPANIVTGNIFNTKGSEFIHLDITNGSTLSNASAIFNTNGLSLITTGTNRREDTFLSNLCQLVKTVYSSFTNQTLVVATSIIDKTLANTNSATKYGDNYISDYSFTSTVYKEGSYLPNITTDLDTTVTTIAQGIKVIRNYVCESNVNLKLKHESIDDNSKYYPKSSYPISTSANLQNSFLRDWDTNKGATLSYNSDYSSLNTFNPVYPYNITSPTLTRFPFRVIVSEQTSNELADSGWRNFLPNNYKDVVSVKGEITNLEAYDDVLLIQAKDTLFRTIGAQTLKTSTEDVTIGNGTLFATEPKEILSSELGYLGSQNMFGCGVTKLGYVFFDVKQGKIFAVGREVKELSSQGLRNYFNDNFKSETTLDNPFTSTGVNMAYDEQYNRLILSKKGTSSFTISYSPDMDGFVSFHDYVPDYLFNTRTKVFSIKGLSLYQHNSSSTKATYYDQTVYPSYIEYVYNDLPDITKYFSAIRWQSEIINSSGTSLYDKTFTKILLYNSYQCSGEIDLINQTNIFHAELTWNFNNFYDVVINRSLPFKDSSGLILSNLNQNMSWFKQRRFVDKWTACRLIYNNTDQNTLFLYDVSSLMRKSGR